MMKSMMRFLLIIPMLALASPILMGFDQGMSGKYGNATMQVEFQSSSEAYVTMVGRAMMEFKYEKDGDKVILRNQGATSSFP